VQGDDGYNDRQVENLGSARNSGLGGSLASVAVAIAPSRKTTESVRRRHADERCSTCAPVIGRGASSCREVSTRLGVDTNESSSATPNRDSFTPNDTSYPFNANRSYAGVQEPLLR